MTTRAKLLVLLAAGLLALAGCGEDDPVAPGGGGGGDQPVAPAIRHQRQGSSSRCTGMRPAPSISRPRPAAVGEGMTVAQQSLAVILALDR